MTISSADYRAHLVDTNVSQGDIWGEHTIVEQYRIEKLPDAGPPPSFSPISSREGIAILADTGGPGGAGVIPGIGEPFQNGTGTSWMDSALVRSIDWQYSPKGSTIGATVRYSTRYFYADDAKGLARTEEDLTNATTLAAGLYLPAMVIPVFKTRSSKIYRDDPGMTGPNASVDLASSDIGGVAKQRSVDVKQVGLKLRMYIDSTSTSVDDLTGIISQYMGMRNSDPFLGYGARNLVCDGGALNHLEHEMYEVVMDYTYDEWFGHSQLPILDSDGRPKGAASNYGDIRWAREVRGEVDFNDIWASGALGESYKYQAFKGVWY